MNQLVAVNRNNWKVVFRSNDNRVVLYNPQSHEFRTTNSTSSSTSHSSQWSSLTYFEILEDHLTLQYNQNEPNPSLSEFLLDGYFKKYFTIQKKIGSGGAGSVYHVKHKLAGYTLADYAAKIVPVGNYSRLKTALLEVKFLQKLSLSHHPFILGYYHCWIENYQPAFLGPQVPCLFILMEYSKYGNLETFLQKNQNLNYKAKWQIFIQILLALNLLHKKKIIHRDLKMSNILVFDDDNISKNPLKFKFVLSDFGTAISEEKQNLKPTFERTGATGTIETMAPELLEQNKDGKFLHAHSFSSDVWALGVIIFNIFIGKNPFASENGEELLRSFTNVDNLLNRLGIYNSDLPNEVMNLIRKMMDKRSYNRITIKEILKNQEVDRFINEFNYNSLIFNFPSSSPTFSEHRNNSSPNISSSLLPVNSHSFAPNTNQILNRNVIEIPTITNDEFHRSTPLPIKYSPPRLRHKRNHKKIKTKNKFYIILFIALASIRCSSWIYYFLHLILVSILLFFSRRNMKLLYILPILTGIETLIFSSNSFVLPILVLILIIFMIE